MSNIDLEDHGLSLFECFKIQTQTHTAAKICTCVLTNFSQFRGGFSWAPRVTAFFKSFKSALPGKYFLNYGPGVMRNFCQSGIAIIGLGVMLSLLLHSPGQTAYVSSLDDELIINKNIDSSRDHAATSPKKETDQVLINGWPLYRTVRGQEAFNKAMATLKVTETASPNIDTFKNCKELRCRLVLPKLGSNGWIPAGRLWTSPSEYVLIVHSPRFGKQDRYRRRSKRKMRIFVFHEFHNSTGNTDVYDTISSHRRSVFVPFYMSKPQTDSKGRIFVVVMQVAPHNIVSRHAFNLGNLGPGIEIAKNKWETLAPLQAKAGILVASIIKVAEPQLRIVRHRGPEGLPSLRAYQRRLSVIRKKTRTNSVVLPFTPALSRNVASVTGNLKDLIVLNYPTAIPIATRVDRQLPNFAVPVPKRVTVPSTHFSTLQKSLTMDGLLQRILSEPSMP